MITNLPRYEKSPGIARSSRTVGRWRKARRINGVVEDLSRTAPLPEKAVCRVATELTLVKNPVRRMIRASHAFILCLPVAGIPCAVEHAVLVVHDRHAPLF